MLFLGFSSLVFACLCSYAFIDIEPYKEAVKESLIAQQNRLDALKQEIDTRTATLKEQETLLKKHNAVYKERYVQQQELIFLLQQKNHLR